MPIKVISAELANWRLHQSRFVGTERVYRATITTWMEWVVRVKSGTSFERETMIRRNMTQRKLFNIHTSPSIHPNVVSPLRLSQLKIKLGEKAVPVTTQVKRMRDVAHA
jgi:hypothetical protein